MLKVYTATDVGLVRAVNEDSFKIFAPNVYAIADGMGGYAAGELASKMLTDTVYSVLHDKSCIEQEDLCLAIRKANENILSYANKSDELSGMGTTATVAHIADDNLIWAHVGDSRLYLLRQGKLMQITCDHSYVEELVAKGSITPAEARTHPKRNYLTRAVGVAAAINIDSGNCKLQTGDILLLATDGLVKLVDDETIADILLTAADNPAQILVNKALAAGGNDNITTVAVFVS